MNFAEMTKQIEQHWPDKTQAGGGVGGSMCEIECAPEVLPELSHWLFLDQDYSFAGLIVEEGSTHWQLRYVFYGEHEAGWIHLLVNGRLTDRNFPTITEHVHAADWHEREAEDLFGLTFTGHPRLGDFVLHDDVWQESVEPMRRHFDIRKAMRQRQPDQNWHPRRVVEQPGAFIMPIGPVYSGVTEPVHFLLETVGEDVIRSVPRLFYKWRGIEKLAEGQTLDNVLLLAERFAATTAFAHGLAYCQAVESIGRAVVPPRAQVLRIFLAELERFRHHVGAIEGICESTALAVASSQAAILEEDLLRVCGELTGHRYLFGLLTPGGLLCDLEDDASRNALDQVQQALEQ
ncbi:MAG TPA: NADH-quinone oxidoreductase subunit C, partial [Candidatus Binatia bacterium]|nr:NADH-quinone oxidoreductase subunit C [Candidatus Binatia bacterium]